MNHSTYAQTRELISGLWPQWDPTDQERSLFGERLGGLTRQDLVQEAVKAHRADRWGSGTAPKLAGILAAYTVLCEDPARDIQPTAVGAWRFTQDQVDEAEAARKAMIGRLNAMGRDRMEAAGRSLIARMAVPPGRLDPLGSLDPSVMLGMIDEHVRRGE